MSKLYSAKINLSKVDKERLFKGKKGTYLDVMIWVNDQADKNGYTMNIQQQVKKGEDRIYIGEGKEFDINKTPQPDNDLPF